MPGWINKNKKRGLDLWEDKDPYGKTFHNKLFQETNILLTEKFSTFRYKIPENKEHLLYDFYMSTLLDVTGDEDADLVLEEMKGTLYPYLADEMLNSVFFAVASEMRHIISGEGLRFGRTGRERLKDKIKTLPEKQKKAMNEYMKLFRSKKAKFAKLEEPLRLLLKPPKGLTKKFLKSHYNINLDARIKSAKAVKKAFKSAGLTLKDFIEVAIDIFDTNGIWDASYGGPAWSGVAKGWKRLAEAKNRNEQIVGIDHIYDLQHNNDTVFNKIMAYYKGDELIPFDIGWLKNALNKKAEIKKPFELFKNISPQLRRLAAFIIKKNFGTTLEDFLKEKDKPEEFKRGDIVKLDSEVANERYDEYGYIDENAAKKDRFIILGFAKQDIQIRKAYWFAVLKDFKRLKRYPKHRWAIWALEDLNQKVLGRVSDKQLKTKIPPKDFNLLVGE